MTWLSNNLAWVGELLVLHLGLALAAMALSLAVSIPVGWLANRFRLGREVVVGLVGALYAVPSLAMFVLVPAIVGTQIRSAATMIIVLSLYGIAMLVRTVSDAFASLPPSTMKSADAMGFSRWKKFWQIELPLAGPVILAGFRVVIVSTVSLVTVGAVVGSQSLGSLFTDGFQRGIVAEVVTGLVLTVALAIVLDALAVLGGKILFPWTRKVTTDGAAQVSS